MQRYNEDLIKQIRKLRKKELLSFSEIGRRFQIPSSTIRNWCYGLDVTRGDTLTKSNELKRKKLINSELHAVLKMDSLTQQQSMFIASILYGCEGSKYPSSNRIEFVNSNPYLVLSFLSLLQKSFLLDINKFRVHLQIHTTQNFESLRQYWSGLLNISEKYFIKPTVTAPKGKKHRNNYNGTCTIRYNDYKIQLKLLGIFEAFTKQFPSTV